MEFNLNSGFPGIQWVQPGSNSILEQEWDSAHTYTQTHMLSNTFTDSCTHTQYTMKHTHTHRLLHMFIHMDGMPSYIGLSWASAPRLPQGSQVPSWPGSCTLSCFTSPPLCSDQTSLGSFWTMGLSQGFVALYQGLLLCGNLFLLLFTRISLYLALLRYKWYMILCSHVLKLSSNAGFSGKHPLGQPGWQAPSVPYIWSSSITWFPDLELMNAIWSLHPLKACTQWGPLGYLLNRKEGGSLWQLPDMSLGGALKAWNSLGSPGLGDIPSWLLREELFILEFCIEFGMLDGNVETSFLWHS